MTTFESHKADLRMQVRLAISDTRKQAGLVKNQLINARSKSARAERGRKLMKQLEEQMRLLDVIDALKEGDPLPLGWQDLRL